MNAAATYAPHAGSFADRALAMLRTLPRGTRLTATQIALGLGMDPAITVSAFLAVPAKHGLVLVERQPGQHHRLYSLTDAAWQAFDQGQLVPLPAKRKPPKAAPPQAPTEDASATETSPPRSGPLMPQPAQRDEYVRGPRAGGVSSPVMHDLERADGQQHRNLPSRRGNVLVYRDGRKELIEQDAPQAQAPQRRLRQFELEQIAHAEGRRDAA